MPAKNRGTQVHLLAMSGHVRPQDAAAPSDTLPRELRKLRDRRDWSQQQLAERLAALGHPVGRGWVAKIETGGRQVTVDELVLLAAALGVSPAALIVPSSEPDAVRLCETKAIDSVSFLRWWRGLAPLRLASEGERDPSEAKVDEVFFLDAVPVREKLQREGMGPVAFASASLVSLDTIVEGIAFFREALQDHDTAPSDELSRLSTALVGQYETAEIILRELRDLIEAGSRWFRTQRDQDTRQLNLDKDAK